MLQFESIFFFLFAIILLFLYFRGSRTYPSNFWNRSPIIGIFNPMSRLDKSTKILDNKSNQQSRFTCTYYCKDEGEVKFHRWSLTYLKVQIIHQDHFNTIKNYSVGSPKGWIGCFWPGKSFMINFRNFLVFQFYFYFTKMHVIERASKLIEV